MAIMQSRYVESNARLMASKPPRERGTGRQRSSLVAQKPTGTAPLLAKLFSGLEDERLKAERRAIRDHLAKDLLMKVYDDNPFRLGAPLLTQTVAEATQAAPATGEQYPVGSLARATLINETMFQAACAAHAPGAANPFPRRVTTAVLLRTEGRVLLPAEVPDDATVEYSMGDMARSAFGYALSFDEPFRWEDAAGTPQQLHVPLGWLDDATLYPNHKARLLSDGFRGAV